MVHLAPASNYCRSAKLTKMQIGDSCPATGIFPLLGNPILKAFCRVAPSVRLSILAIAPAGFFFRARVFSWLRLNRLSEKWRETNSQLLIFRGRLSGRAHPAGIPVLRRNTQRILLKSPA